MILIIRKKKIKLEWLQHENMSSAKNTQRSNHQIK